MSARHEEALAPAELAAVAAPTGLADPMDYEEDDEYALRVQLGLRPISYAGSATKDSHPDQRPCPSWCWIGQHEEYDHEIEPGSIFVARHSYEPRISFPASLYRGQSAENGRGESIAVTATIELDMSSLGTGRPSIRIGRRAYDRERHQHYEERLKLSISDAQDLVASLRHLLEVAAADEVKS